MNKRTIIWILIGVLTLIIVWLLFWFLPFLVEHVHCNKDIVSYLDISFASATALFTGVAFTIAYISLYQQNKGLKRQLDMDVFSDTLNLIMASDRFTRSKMYIYSEEYYYDMSKLKKMLGLAEKEKIKLDDFRRVCFYRTPSGSSIHMNEKTKKRLRKSYEKISYFCGRMEYLGFMSKKEVAEHYILEFYWQTILDSYNILNKHIYIAEGGQNKYYLELYREAQQYKK